MQVDFLKLNFQIQTPRKKNEMNWRKNFDEI